MNIWNVEGPDPDPTASPGHSRPWRRLHFLRNALRRRWPVWATAALLGVLLASGWAWHAQSTSRQIVTLLLAHDPAVDAGTAMATDVNLLDTRAVALAVIQKEGLDMTSAEFRGGVTAVPLTSLLPELEVPTPGRRGREEGRAGTLADEFLDFRGEQAGEAGRRGDRGLPEPDRHHAGAGGDSSTSRYETLFVGTALEQSEAGDVFAQRARILGQVWQVQRSIRGHLPERRVHRQGQPRGRSRRGEAHVHDQGLLPPDRHRPDRRPGDRRGLGAGRGALTRWPSPWRLPCASVSADSTGRGGGCWDERRDSAMSLPWSTASVS